MKILTHINHPEFIPNVLTKVNTSFVLGFKYPLLSDYTFKEISKENIRQFQNFLNKVSKMTLQEVETAFAQKPDKNDEFKGIPVHHYKVNKSFRIHTIFEDGVHIIIRIDPNHHFHS